MLKSEKKTESDKKSEDALTKLIGNFGKWQLIIFISIILIKVSSAWVQMAILFLTPQSTFICVEFSTNLHTNTSNVKNSTCYDDCVKYSHDTSPYVNTIVSEWDLICERKWMASFTQMILQLGILLGSILFGFLSDRFGRKYTFLSSVACILIFGFAIPFSPNYWIFTALRFFLGVSTAGTMVVSFVITVEITSSQYREILACAYHLPFVIGHVTLPLFAYLFNSWSSYCLALVAPELFYLIYFVLIPESPRWLASVGRVDEATAIVKKAAEMNNLPTTDIDESIAKFSADLMNRSENARPNYSDLFKSDLIIRTACIIFIWFSAGLMFYGFNQYLSQTSSNSYISTVAAGLVQIPSMIASMWLIKRFGRRLVVSTSACLGGLCIISLGLVPKIFYITITLSTIGVCFAAIVTTVIYVYTSELYPTVVRNMGMGVGSTSMRFGSMIAPFVSNMSTLWLPTLIIGCTQICAGLVCLCLPETKGKMLPDSIDDLRSNEEKSKL